MNDMEKLNLNLHALVIFHNLLNDKGLIQLSELLTCSNLTPLEQVKKYSAFVSQLFNANDNFTDYIFNLILKDENSYVLKRQQKLPTDDILEDCLKNELKILEKIAGLSPDKVKTMIHYEGYLPSWKTSPIDFYTTYQRRMDNLQTHGFGLFAEYHMFSIKNTTITPVKCPDPIRLSDLTGYENERKSVVNNTLAFLKRRPAANVLLHGDAGTGKSTTIKAIVNEYYHQGLRLIEMTKKQLNHLPEIVENLSKNPLRFILFIDDLSFTKENDDFNALKAILEGSVSAKTPNIVIYATSNRRHLIKETFSDREGDDIHRNETIQELISLSERFGLAINFYKPNKEEYLKIVQGLKAQYALKLNGIELEQEAERYALLRGGRSPRVARQFVEYMKSIEE